MRFRSCVACLAATGQISQGKTRDVHPIYPEHLRQRGPNDIGLWAFRLPRPPAVASYALRVPRAGTLLTASFRSPSRRAPLLFGSEFLSLRPPEGLTPSTSIPGSLSLSGSKRRSRRFAPCLAHLDQRSLWRTRWQGRRHHGLKISRVMRHTSQCRRRASVCLPARAWPRSAPPWAHTASWSGCRWRPGSATLPRPGQSPRMPTRALLG